MSVKFDSAAVGEGVEVRYRLESGKAMLEWHFHYANEDPGQGYFLRVRMMDKEGCPVLECLQQTQEEEPMQSVLLHPHLWQGIENPYLYRLEAEIFSPGRKQVDRCVRLLPLYVLECLPGKGLLLNGETFCPRTVRYRPPEQIKTAEGQRLLMQDMQLIREMGANGIFLEGVGEKGRLLLQICQRLGLLVWDEGNSVPGNSENPENLPCFRGGSDSLLKEDGSFSAQYYRYRARWSKTPFVYIVPESIRQQENGLFMAAVYSSCKKVALYSNGILHEFQSGREEFIFRGITAESPCLVLTAEAEECAQSFSIHKTFTKSSLFHDI